MYWCWVPFSLRLAHRRLKCFLTRRVIRPQTSRAFSTRRFSTGIRRAMLEDRKRQHLYRHVEESLRICWTCAFTEMAQMEQTHFFTEIPPSAVDCNVSLVYLWRTERLHETQTDRTGGLSRCDGSVFALLTYTFQIIWFISTIRWIFIQHKTIRLIKIDGEIYPKYYL